MRFNNYSKFLPLVLVASALTAQMAPVVKIETQPSVKAKRGAATTVTLKVAIPEGFHANSATPTDANLIPLKLTWTGGPFQAGAITYPKAQMEKYSFTSGKGISVVTGAFEITTKFTVPATAAQGAGQQVGTLRYQACNDRMCFAPKTLPVNLSVSVE